jgi:hypothetical protein
MLQISAYDHVRLEMEEVRRRAELLGRHVPPTTRGSTRTRTRRLDRTWRP